MKRRQMERNRAPDSRLDTSIRFYNAFAETCRRARYKILDSGFDTAPHDGDPIHSTARWSIASDPHINTRPDLGFRIFRTFQSSSQEGWLAQTLHWVPGNLLFTLALYKESSLTWTHFKTVCLRWKSSRTSPRQPACVLWFFFCGNSINDQIFRMRRKRIMLNYKPFRI